MKRLMLDTGVASDYIFRRNGVYERVRECAARGIRIGIAMPAIGELFAGVEHSQSRERNRDILKRDIHGFRPWPFDRKAAEEFGRLYAYLRSIGRPMQQIDVQIAAIALSLGSCRLATRDGDFRAIPGLDLEIW
jgi:tRNA(fMet)-specific endonuclease VapC